MNDTRPHQPRDRGLSLVEIITAMTVFSIFLLSTGASLMSGIAQRRAAFQTYTASTAIRDQIAEIQEIANYPLSTSAQRGIGAIYTRYNGQSIAVPELAAGVMTITCFADETSVPTELGGPQDLNFDGDAADDLSGTSASWDLKLVPTRMSIEFGPTGQKTTMIVHRLFTMTTN